MSLIHLIYLSTAREAFESAELDRILDTAARRNAPENVTGMLLYAQGSFLQVLEGEALAVDETFARVQRDPRHSGVYVIERAPVAERSFPTWTMGFRRLGAEDAARHPAYAPFFEKGFDVASLGAKPGLALELLLSFCATLRA